MEYSNAGTSKPPYLDSDSHCQLSSDTYNMLYYLLTKICRYYQVLIRILVKCLVFATCGLCAFIWVECFKLCITLENFVYILLWISYIRELCGVPGNPYDGCHMAMNTSTINRVKQCRRHIRTVGWASH